MHPSIFPAVFCCRLLLACGLLGALAGKTQQHKPYWSNELGTLAHTPEAPGWYRFKAGAVQGGPHFFERHKKAFGLGPTDSMGLSRTQKDGSGRLHHRFQQYHRGIKVEGAEFWLHEKDGAATSGNGAWVAGWNDPATPTVPESKALMVALDAVPAHYYLDGPAGRTVKARSAYRPRATLVYQKPNADLPHTPEHLRLCYRVDVFTEKGQGFAVYVDARAGTLVNLLPLQSQCTPTTATTNWYGQRVINTTAGGPGYLLMDDCTPSQVRVYNNANAVAYSGNQYAQATNTSWSSSPELQSAATSLWSCRQVIDFYQAVFQRNGYDNAGGDVHLYQNAGFSTGTGVGYGNASMSFTGGLMKVGNNGTASPLDDWNTLDIIAHEFTHAVTGATAQLVYQGEPGALNESFSDIMGVYTEWWENSTPPDWLVGEDRGGAFRNLQNPAQFGHPATYKTSPNWYSGTADNGGVHINSGVQNFWFYLLANGGSGTNDNGKAYSVKGIGLANAGFIAYTTYAYYLTSGAQYLDARNQSIQVAIDYYGGCSVAALETAKAWYAVGVGGAQTLAGDRNVCGSFTASAQALQFKGVDLLPVAKGCSVTLNAAANPYLFSAAKTVVLYPGFTALEGSTVNIYTDSCNITLNTYAQVAAKRPEMLVLLPEGGAVAASAPQALEVYPNPARQQAKLVFHTPRKTTGGRIVLYDATGREVYNRLLGNLEGGAQQVALSLAGLSQGTYLIVMHLDKEQLRTRLVVVQ